MEKVKISESVDKVTKTRKNRNIYIHDRISNKKKKTKKRTGKKGNRERIIIIIK